MHYWSLFLMLVCRFATVMCICVTITGVLTGRVSYDGWQVPVFMILGAFFWVLGDLIAKVM